MAKNKVLLNGSGGEVSLSDPMPPTEPGHKGESLGGGDVFDPNAALRYKEGRGPGLQDSERMQPAHWVQPGDEESAKLAVEAEAKRLEDRAKSLRNSLKGDDAVVVGPPKGEADVRGESKAK
jgi:hypothetical protein